MPAVAAASAPEPAPTPPGTTRTSPDPNLESLVNALQQLPVTLSAERTAADAQHHERQLSLVKALAEIFQARDDKLTTRFERVLTQSAERTLPQEEVKNLRTEVSRLTEKLAHHEALRPRMWRVLIKGNDMQFHNGLPYIWVKSGVEVVNIEPGGSLGIKTSTTVKNEFLLEITESQAP